MVSIVWQAVEKVSGALGSIMIPSDPTGLEGLEMRGGDDGTGEHFSYVDLEARARKDHPLRKIREIVNTALSALSGDFAGFYSSMAVLPSIAPEKLLRAMLLQAFYSIHSERLLMELLEYDLLFHWFVGIGVDDPAWNHSTFSKNRDRLLDWSATQRALGVG